MKAVDRHARLISDEVVGDDVALRPSSASIKLIAGSRMSSRTNGGSNSNSRTIARSFGLDTLWCATAFGSANAGPPPP